MNKIIKYLFLLIFISLLNFNQIYAQDDDDEMSELGWKDTLGFSFGLQYLKSATETKTLNYGFKYAANFEGVWDLEISIKGAYGKTEKVLSQNEHAMELTASRWFYKSPWAITALGNIEHNETSFIYIRAMSGMGVKYRPIQEWWIELSFAVEPIIEYTRSLDLTEEEAIIKTQNTVGLIFSFDQDKTNTLATVSKYFLNFKKTKEYRIETTITLKLNIIGIVSLENTFKYEYTAKPLGGDDEESVPKSNYSVLSALSIEFGT